MIQIEETEVISYNDTCNETIVIVVNEIRQKLFFIKIIFYYISFALTLLTFIFGTASWCIIRKFRDYKNFVFLNTFLSNVLLYILVHFTILNANHRDIFDRKDRTWLTFLFIYLLTVKNQWLVVMCHMLYVDIVKVFSRHTGKRFLKSAIFGWILALIPSGTFFYAHVYLFERYVMIIMIKGILVFPLIVNCTFYLVIIFSICRSFNSNAHTATDNWRRLYLATVIFISSDILLVTMYVIKIIWPTTNGVEGIVAKALQIILYNLNTIILNIFFITVRSNRETWCEFYDKKIKERSLSGRPKNKDINMQEINVCKPDTDSRSINLDV